MAAEVVLDVWRNQQEYNKKRVGATSFVDKTRENEMVRTRRLIMELRMMRAYKRWNRIVEV